VLVRIPTCTWSAAATTCKAWHHILVLEVRELRSVPLGQLPQLMRRFPHTKRAGVCDEAEGTHYDPASFAAALLVCPRPLQKLTISGWHYCGAAGLCELASTTACGAVWAARLHVLELDLMFVPALPRGFAAALPQLREVSLSRYRNGGHGLEAILGCERLAVLRLRSVYCGTLPDLGSLRSLSRLEILDGYNLRELPEGPASALQALAMRRCQALTELHLSNTRLPALTSLTAINCPALFHAGGRHAAFGLPIAAVPHASLLAFVEHADSRLPGISSLTQLRRLDLGGNAQLRRLPRGIRHLCLLTSLSLDGATLDDCRPAAPSAEGLALAPLTGCRRLEVLLLAGVTGIGGSAALLPSVLGEFLTRLQVGG